MTADFPPEAALKRVPAIGTDPETLLADSTIYIKFVDRASGWKWYILEWDGDATFFGLIVGGVTAVAGQFGRDELEGLRRDDGSGLMWDADFEPLTVSRLSEEEPSLLELLAEPAPREVNARGLVDLE